MVYTDTDSFVFHTKTDDIYQGLKEINDEMDFSGYEKNHKCYDATNKKVLGKFKDEVGGKIMAGFIGLRPKCYAFRIHGGDTEYEKCKGTAKNTVKRKINMMITIKYQKLIKLFKGHLIVLGVRTKRYIVLILQKQV